MSRFYVLYDERAVTMGSNSASVLCCADSLKEIKEDSKSFGYTHCAASYSDDDTLGDERGEYVYYEDNGFNFFDWT